MRRRVPASSSDEPALIEVHLFDPQTDTKIVYFPATRIATRQHQSQPRENMNFAVPGSHRSDG